MIKMYSRVEEQTFLFAIFISILQVRLINKDAHDDSSPGAMLTIWHPPEDLVSLLSEGKLYEFHKVVAGGLRYVLRDFVSQSRNQSFVMTFSSFGCRNGQVQLTANRQTKYKHLSAGDLSCYGRRVTSFGELKTDFKVAFGECDIVGLVIRVREIENNPKNDSTPTIYLADLNKNLMIVKFRTNVKVMIFLVKIFSIFLVYRKSRSKIRFVRKNLSFYLIYNCLNF